MSERRTVRTDLARRTTTSRPRARERRPRRRRARQARSADPSV